MAGGSLRPGDVVWVNIPHVGPHPAVVVVDLGGAGYIVVNGTGAPQDETPVVTLSAAAAKRCGLSKETAFYASKEFVWLWRADAGACSVGRMLPAYAADLRSAALATLTAMARPAAEIGKLPPTAGFSFPQMSKFVSTLSAPKLTPANSGLPPAAPPSASSAGAQPAPSAVDATIGADGKPVT